MEPTTNRTVYLGKLTNQICKQYSERALSEICSASDSSLFWEWSTESSSGLFSFTHTVPSQLQRRLGSLIRLRFSSFRIRENIRPRWLTSPRGERLELDFYLPELRLAFEVQGEQHYRFTPVFHKKSDDFANQVRRDIAKRERCIALGVELIELASESDWHQEQDRISEIIDSAGKTTLSDYLARRTAQEVVNTISLKMALAELDAKAARDPFEVNRAAMRRRRRKLIESIEKSAEIQRYISVIAIQEYYGLRPVRARRGWDRWIAWRRTKQSKTESGTWVCLPIKRFI